MHQATDRKIEEKEVHDRLRGELREDPYYNSNKKFYSISDSNRKFVKNWLQAGCRGKRVLDYCCGDGEMALWLAEQGAQAVGIDISPVSVENARAEARRRGLPNADFLVMDAEKTDFPDGHFDFAVVHGVLHHLDLDKAYAELARVLSPVGQAICTEALRHNVFIHSYRRRTPHLRSAWETKHILGKTEIYTARHYFEKVEVVRFFHLATLAAVPFRNLSIFGPVRRMLQLVDHVLLSLPFVRWQAWMAVFVLGQPRPSLNSGTRL